MFEVNRASRRFDGLAGRVLQGDGLSFLEGLVLAAIFFEAPEPVKPSQLAEAFATTRGNVSHCVSSLEAKGLLQRKVDPTDARAFNLELKPAGKKCALRVIGAFDRLQREFERRNCASKSQAMHPMSRWWRRRRGHCGRRPTDTRTADWPAQR